LIEAGRRSGTDREDVLRQILNCVSAARSGEAVMKPDYARLPWPAQTGPNGPQIAANLVFTEGPAVDDAGRVYFSDIENNRILRWCPREGRSVFREPSFRANGQAFDPAGRLLHCEGFESDPSGGRRITRTDLRSGHYEVLTDRYAGARYHSPNDICSDAQGNLYFTDPRYGDRTHMEMADESVYHISPAGVVTRILTQPDIQRPNGIAVTQDGRTLYVIDSCPVIGGHRKIWAFTLAQPGCPSKQRLVHDFAPGRGGDGMELDQNGLLYVAAGIFVPRGPHETTDVPPGVYILTPEGEFLNRIPVYEDLITNVAFGGPDGRTLYITAGKSLYQTRVDTPGQVAYPNWSV